jgi:hypothetical protein
MKLFGTVLALTCCGASAAKADWEYTKWGMTAQQVVSATKNLARESSDRRPDTDGNVTKLVAPYKSGKFSFEAQFEFDPADRLSAVTLLLTDKSSCHDLQVSVETRYGPVQGGTSTSLYIIENWQDQKNRNSVTYTAVYGSGCYVHYSGIKPAGAD